MVKTQGLQSFQTMKVCSVTLRLVFALKEIIIGFALLS